MSVPTAQQCNDYALALRIIRMRIAAAEGAIAGEITTLTLESAALHLRMALETLLQSSLVTHQHLIGEITRAIRRGDAEAARRRVRALNPEWWPSPVRAEERNALGLRPLTPIEDGCLTEEEWGRSFGFASSLLHMSSPFGPEPDCDAQGAHLRAIADRLRSLLALHLVALPGGGYQFLVDMNDPDHDGDVGVYIFERISDA